MNRFIASGASNAYVVDMHETVAARMLNALAQPTRLRVVVLLSSASDGAMGSGDIADAVGVPRNLMSSHLAILSKAGLLASVKTGRTVRYALDGTVIAQLAAYLDSLA